MNLKLHVIMGLFCIVAATPASAVFQVESEYQSAEPYGNSQIPCFRGAILGGTPEFSDEASLLDGLPLREVGHFYGRMGANSGSVRLSGLRNNVNNLSAYPAGGVVNTKARQNQTGLEMALGYFWAKNMRLELEALFNKSFPYSSNPALSFPPGTTTATLNSSLVAHVKNMSFLINGYYEFMFGGYDRFHPFIVAGAGVALNSAQTTLTQVSATDPPTTTTTKRKGSLAIGGGIGFRFVVFSRVSLFASFRYISLGRVYMDPVTNFRVKGNHSMAPFSLGLQYLF